MISPTPVDTQFWNGWLSALMTVLNLTKARSQGERCCHFHWFLLLLSEWDSPKQSTKASDGFYIPSDTTQRMQVSTTKTQDRIL